MIGYKGWRIPEGNVVQVAKDGVVLWALQSGKSIVLEVEKITSDTYAGETTYTGEQFILLDIYPKTNGTVNVTYGGLTKTITDTSGAEEPNAQKVFFGTFNGVSDSVATPTSGTLTIEGDCVAFGISTYNKTSKDTLPPCCNCVTGIVDMGEVEYIPNSAFGYTGGSACDKITKVDIPKSVKTIGSNAFLNCTGLVSVIIGNGVTTIGGGAFQSCTSLPQISLPSSVTLIGLGAFVSCNSLKTIEVLSTTPPKMEENTVNVGAYTNLGSPGTEQFVLEQIIVPKGCSDTYKATEGWKYYYENNVDIVEVS